MTALRLYTDGSCHPPGAVGGWAWILVDDHVVGSGSGTTPGSSTHQASELTAAIEGLAHLVACGVREVTLLSDSKYLVEGMSSNGRTGWAHAAVTREWRTTRGKPLLNRELWERLLELEGCLAVTWCHVPGHRPKWDTSDDARYNREVDALAGEARRGFVVPAPNGAAPLRRTSDVSAAMTPEIQERLDRYVAAVNGGDADAAAEAWADDGKQLAPGAPPAVGRDAIRESIRAVQQMSPQLELQSVDVLVEGNVAIDTGTWSVKLQTPDGPVEDGGPAVRVWRRGTDGVWRLYRDIWNSEQPPEPG